MKQKDVILIIFIAFLSMVVSIVISKAVITTPKNRQQQVEVVPAITIDFPQPDSKYFNSGANDPTKLITIGANSNPQPFNGASN